VQLCQNVNSGDETRVASLLCYMGVMNKRSDAPVIWEHVTANLRSHVFFSKKKLYHGASVMFRGCSNS
jgi:hypothetical protein